MTMTPTEFKAAYPEFSSVADASIQAQLDAFDLLYQGDYGDLSDYLSGLYAAHQVTVYTTNTSASPAQTVEARSVDGLSWKYAKAGNAEKAGDFASTKYGLEFYRLISMFGQGPVMAKAVP
jgi:hypothetical protein